MDGAAERMPAMADGGSTVGEQRGGGVRPDAAGPALPPLLIVLGPSGAGKTAVVGAVLAREPRLRRLVTATTRQRRPGERDGIDYHFLSRAAFEAGIAAGEFLEWKTVYGNLYGVPRWALREAGADGAVLVVDRQGAAELSAAHPQLVVTFCLLPPDLTTLRARLVARDGDGADVERRLASVDAEVAEAEAGRWDRTIVNDDLATTVDALHAAMLDAIASWHATARTGTAAVVC